jgi:hypothetical protein
MMDILVYEYLLTPVIISPMLKQFLLATCLLITHVLGGGNWIHNCICA